MAQRRLKADQFQSGNVHSFPEAASVPDGSSEALDLVYRAADMFRALEDRARETEARAHAMCRDASDKVRQAEMRAEAAERAHRELAIAADQRLCEASNALEQAQSRIRSQADKLTAAEFRAQAAEAETRQAKRALALVEEAIRKRLLA
jgi:hypothetical protein